MNEFIVYPRGFVAGDPNGGTGVVLSSGDSVADSLYDALIELNGAPKGIELIDSTLDYAIAQFGDFTDWLDHQLGCSLVQGNQREFLLDTLDYIHGRGRLVSLINWQFILDPLKIKPSDVRVKPLFQAKQYLTPDTASTTQILQKWCQQKGGINDLICTLHVLFGHTGRTPV